MQNEGEGALPCFLFEDRGDVGIGIARMDDQRQAGLGAPRRYACESPAPAHRAATCRSGSRARPRRSPPPLGCAERRTSSSAVTSSFFGGVVRMGADRAEDLVEFFSDLKDLLETASLASRSLPCARRRRPCARATMAARSSEKSGKSRWQWLSTSIVRCLRSSSVRFDIARKHRLRRRQDGAGYQRMSAVDMRETRAHPPAPPEGRAALRPNPACRAGTESPRVGPSSAVVHSTVSMRAGSVFFSAQGSCPAK